MGPESAHQETGPEPTPPAEVAVTPSQADAARLIIEIDRAAGKETSGLIHKIADARPSRRGLVAGPAERESPTSSARLSIEIERVALPGRSPSRLRFLRRGARQSGPEAR